MEEPAIAVRAYASDDLDALFRLDEICFQEPFRFSRPDIRRFAEDPRARTWLAEQKARLLGFILVHVAHDGAYIVTLDVAPQDRRRGIGHLLMKRGEREAQAHGSPRMLLHVFTGNQAALQFYAACGYERLRLHKNFYARGLDAWVYCKTL